MTILDAGAATLEPANPEQRRCIDEVEVGREVAPRLWRSLGFAVVGTVPDAFDHPVHGPVALLVMHRPR